PQKNMPRCFANVDLKESPAAC
ncbi:MAG: hypothetical protein HW398_1197, partial [Acidobacteria bacterium]|nr:hypothetical protein [Acidobacteriota bacterium]